MVISFNLKNLQPEVTMNGTQNLLKVICSVSIVLSNQVVRKISNYNNEYFFALYNYSICYFGTAN